jgi:hypothetical protein
MSVEGDIGRNGLNTSQEVGFFGSGLRGRQRRRYPRPAKARAFVKGHAKALGMLAVSLAVCVALLASAMAVPHSADGKAAQGKIPATTSQGIPPPPYPVQGYTNDSLGNPIECYVVITDLDSGANWTGWSNFTNDGINYYPGFYQINIAPLDSALPYEYSDGDTLEVVATSNTSLTGSNTGLVSNATAYTTIDVVVSTVIPEFSVVVVPIVGLVAIVAVMSHRRRGELQ